MFARTRTTCRTHCRSATGVGTLGFMTPELLSVVLTGAGVLLGVWRIHAHYETRNDAAHAELRAAIARVADDLRPTLVKVAEDVAYLRGRQDERDRQ